MISRIIIFIIIIDIAGFTTIIFIIFVCSNLLSYDELKDVYIKQTQYINDGLINIIKIYLKNNKA